MHSHSLRLSPDVLSDAGDPLSMEGGPADVLARSLEALQGREDDATRWLVVAQAFRAAGQPVQAIDACEACLKLDPKLIDAWFLIAELALAVGHREMAGEAYDVVRQLAPEDPRLANVSVAG